jgi:tRNA(Ile)-lysidine synthase
VIESVERRARELLDAVGVEAGAPVLVGASGGPDSTVVADLAARWSAAGRLGPVTLLYVDHGLRPGSAADGDRIAALAGQLGVAAEVRTVEVDRSRASLEAAARSARYRAFDQLARERGARWVLLGHTATDQAETVVMRLIRGTGITGLAAIPPRRGRYLRPLLEVTREQVEAYLSGRGLPHISDPMNDDPQFTRNRVRDRIMPLLVAENPAVVDALCRVAAAAREQSELVDDLASELLARARRSGGLACELLRTAPPAVAKRAISLAAGGQLGADHLAQLVALIAGPAAGTRSIDLPGGRAVREYETLHLVAGEWASPAAPELSIEGPEPPYRVRRWQPGDRMRPDRLRGRSRKLSDLFTDAKLPVRRRREARVVVRASDDEIVWAEHVGPAHGSRVTVTLTPPQPVASNKC